MKTTILSIVLAFAVLGCASNQMQNETEVQPQNIDKNNVGITKGEKLDQSDPTLIEGNLEDNDLKN